MICELEFEDMAEFLAFWDEWERTRGGAFVAELDPLAERITEEILRVVD